jgi:50S ribosomal subunit-associated GTPase HflX
MAGIVYTYFTAGVEGQASWTRSGKAGKTRRGRHGMGTKKKNKKQKMSNPKIRNLKKELEQIK